jgi:ABC-type antimicrobial peptide transport system permease subunit
MYRLGLQLSLRSGREALIRLILTMVAVAVGVAILLAVLADFHAFQVTNSRPSWESTQGAPVSQKSGSASNAELWNYSNDIFKGQTIERLDVAALGPRAPVPPGISRLPASGQYYASPALAALIRSVPRDELGARFPGSQVGTIGQQALTGPNELVVFVGSTPARLAALPSTVQVSKIATAPGKQLWSKYFRYAFGAGAIAFLFPILILIGTATRLAAARREERYAALRLVGATSRQISVISSVDAIVGALLGTALGIGIFTLLQPALADTAITSARYFANDVTPTGLGYVGVLVAVPVASAIGSLLSLRRIRISPLGVSRRVTPPAPTAWRLIPLLAGIALFVVGLDRTTARSIGGAAFPGLLLILVGLIVGGPWLTAQAARLASIFAKSASSLVAARRLADNPRAAFRSVRGLVLAVFLGTLVAAFLPFANSTTATPSANALSNVLLDGFMSAPVCGNNVNCTGGQEGSFGPGDAPASQPTAAQAIALEGLPPKAGAQLVRQLRTYQGATVFPLYSAPQAAGQGGPGGPGKGGPGGGNGSGGPPGGPKGFGGNAIVSCASLRQLAVLGQCAPGVKAVEADTSNLIQSDNPLYSTEAIAGRSSPAVSDNFSRLYLQAVLVKVNSPATLERVRTFLVSHTAQSASGTAPRTFGEAVQARVAVGTTVQRLVYIAVALTLLVAGCSLAVAVGGSLVERKRPFTLLRVSGTPTSALYKVVFLEAAVPLIAAALVAAAAAYGISVLLVGKLAPAGTPVPVPGHVYYLTMGTGLVISLLVVLVTLPLLGRITLPANARFE